jgi:hypothetical protein
MQNDYYAGMFVFDLSDMSVLALSDSKYPEDLKATGGMFKTGDKSIRDTACRECIEEGQTRVTKSTLVFVETLNNRHGVHKKYFFLSDEVSNTLAKGATWQGEEKENGRVVEKFITRWVSFPEFVKKLFDKQYPAFGAVLAELARRNPDLLTSSRFCELMERFPEPEDLGLQGVCVD